MTKILKNIAFWQYQKDLWIIDHWYLVAIFFGVFIIGAILSVSLTSRSDRKYREVLRRSRG